MSILSILEPANSTSSSRPAVARLTTGSIPATVAADLLVPLADGRVTDYANFDHGASAPCLESVRAAVEAALPSYASVHRGNGYASRITTQWYERARNEVHTFVGARSTDQVIFTRQTTDALNLLARAVPVDATVIVFESEHHAALLPGKPSAPSASRPRPPRRQPSPPSPTHSVLRPMGRGWSSSPAPPTSPARSSRSPRSPLSPRPTARGCASTPLSWRRTAW